MCLRVLSLRVTADNRPGSLAPQRPPQSGQWGGRPISLWPGALSGVSDTARQEKAAACVAMDIRRRDQMLLFLALQCQFIGGILGTRGKGRRAWEPGFCLGQVMCECSGLWAD